MPVGSLLVTYWDLFACLSLALCSVYYVIECMIGLFELYENEGKDTSMWYSTTHDPPMRYQRQKLCERFHATTLRRMSS